MLSLAWLIALSKYARSEVVEHMALTFSLGIELFGVMKEGNGFYTDKELGETQSGGIPIQVFLPKLSSPSLKSPWN